jgi:hypothetical protein
LVYLSHFGRFYKEKSGNTGHLSGAVRFVEVCCVCKGGGAESVFVTESPSPRFIFDWSHGGDLELRQKQSLSLRSQRPLHSQGEAGHPG